jgi:23S rRNA (cytosine1962-C5)-methyltransferase
MSLPTLKLKAQEERRLRAGHLWIYSNEVDTAKSPLHDFARGSLCRIEDARGHPLGTGYINPNALLCARLLTSRADATIDADWFARRIAAALHLRERLYDAPYYRLVYGEADGVPGLVVDRYGDVLVAQFGTAGIDAQREAVLEALRRVLKPSGIWLANDLSSRELEGLPRGTEAIGTVPEAVEVREGASRFMAPIREGQKTGWFYDQRDNRDRLARYVKGARVLDVFSYIGAWGVRAAEFGATSVTCVDGSAPALARVAENAGLNGRTIETLKGDALDVMKALRAEGRSFELVIVDPPALIKRKKDHAAGFEHYVQLNRAALELLVPGGFLVSCSCSFHLEAAELQRALLRAARSAGRRLSILDQGGQGPDHPVHPAIPETRYLKAFFCSVAGE